MGTTELTKDQAARAHIESLLSRWREEAADLPDTHVMQVIEDAIALAEPSEIALWANLIDSTGGSLGPLTILHPTWGGSSLHVMREFVRQVFEQMVTRREEEPEKSIWDSP